MSFAIQENRFAILRNIKNRFAICDLRSVNSDPVTTKSFNFVIAFHVTSSYFAQLPLIIKNY